MHKTQNISYTKNVLQSTLPILFWKNQGSLHMSFSWKLGIQPKHIATCWKIKWWSETMISAAAICRPFGFKVAQQTSYFQGSFSYGCWTTWGWWPNGLIWPGNGPARGTMEVGACLHCASYNLLVFSLKPRCHLYHVKFVLTKCVLFWSVTWLRLRPWSSAMDWRVRGNPAAL